MEQYDVMAGLSCTGGGFELCIIICNCVITVVYSHAICDLYRQRFQVMSVTQYYEVVCRCTDAGIYWHNTPTECRCFP